MFWLMAALAFELAEPATAEKFGDFMFLQKSDPITDKVQAAAIVNIGENTLSIGCNNADENRVRVMVITKKYISPYSGIYIDLRFDALPASRPEWNLERSILYVRQKKAVAQFAHQAMVSGKVTFRIEGADHQNIDIVFPLLGAAGALKRVAQACGDADFSASVADAAGR